MVINLVSDSVPMFLDDELFTVLVDTGATISVFTGTAKIFNVYFPNAHDSGYDTIVSGFGGKGHLCPVYIIPVFKVKGLVIKNLPVAIQHNDSIEADMILASSVFKNSPFTIDYSKRIFEVKSKEIRCRYTMHSVLNLIKGFTVFTQE